MGYRSVNCFIIVAEKVRLSKDVDCPGASTNDWVRLRSMGVKTVYPDHGMYHLQLW